MEQTTLREFAERQPEVGPGLFARARAWAAGALGLDGGLKGRQRRAAALFDQELIETLDALARIDSLLAAGPPDARALQALAAMGRLVSAMPSRFVAVASLRRACAHVLAGEPSPMPCPAMDSPTEDEISCALIVDEALAIGSSNRLLPVHENLPGAVADALNAAISLGVCAMHAARREGEELARAIAPCPAGSEQPTRLRL